MEGAVELAEEIFHMPVRLGMPQAVKGLADVVRNPIYSTSVGLLHYAMRKQAEGKPSSSFHQEPDVPMLERIKRWVQGNF